ncbi:MAG: signal peptide peptidase SppA [Geobacteraceae bacterium]|nr:signal peptide peptidase SppA [Geobacteraceae bacterium]
MKIMSIKPIYAIFIAFVAIFCISIIISKLIIKDGISNQFGKAIGVIEIKGMIVESNDYIHQLHSFRDNKRVKAVVLRIDSPGGVVGPTQEICEEVRKFVRKKPLVVSMGSVAASGGYYIAAPSNLIFANPGTVTGSIGVLMKLSNVQGLLGKIGLKIFVIKSGALKDSGSPLRPMSKEDRALFQDVINSMHVQFVTAVSEGRRIPLQEVRKIADGRIFSGEQALQHKLVDRLGNFQDAVAAAAKLSGITEENPKLIYPAKKKSSLLDFVIQGSSAWISDRIKSETDMSFRYEIPSE